MSVKVGKDGRVSYYYRCKNFHVVQSYRPLSQEEVDDKCKKCLKEDLSTWRDVVG